MPLERARIAHYRIVERLGAGGMGEVYLAEDERLSRRVALKVLSPNSTDPAAQRRFLQEAQTISSVSDANLAHVYEVGCDDGIDFIAMEYVDGETLASRISRTSLTTDEILDIATQIAAGTAAAHARGIVHRDIKPGNVMLTNSGQVKVLDFGLAKIDNKSSEKIKQDDATFALTTPGYILGTTNYMSPEQALGHRVDIRSDIFSIGVVLYEIITRRLPFAGKTTADTLHRITTAAPEPMARYNYDLPIELERIVRRCLEKAPERRYASAKDLGDDLKALMRDRNAHHALPWLRATKRRWLVPVAIASVVIAFVAFLLFRTGAHGEPPVRSIAVLPFANRSQVADADYLTDGLTQDVIHHLSADPSLRVMARSTVFRYKTSALAPKDIGGQLGVDVVLLAEMMSHDGTNWLSAELVSTKDGAHLWGKRYAVASSDLMSVEQDLSTDVAAALQHGQAKVARAAPPDLARSASHELYLRGQFEFNKRTAAGLRGAVEAYMRAVNADPTYALPYAALVETYSLSERYADVPSVATWSKARECAATALRLDPALPEAHVAMASIYDTYDWSWSAAEAEYRKAIALRPGYAQAHQWYALLLARLDRRAEAEREITSALTLDPLSPIVNTAFANVLYYARRYEDSLEAGRKASQLDPSFGLAAVQVALTLNQQRRFAEAITTVEGAARSGSATAIATLAIARAGAGDTDSARAAIGTLNQRSTYYPVAAVEAALGERDAALAALQHATAVRSAYLGYLNVEPVFDALHSDARFTALLRQAHLVP